MKPACVVAFLLLTLTTIASDVCACTIPVFRYALDRWETDKFELILPPDTAANPDLSNHLRPLRANGTANLAITTAKDPSITSPQLRTARLGVEGTWNQNWAYKAEATLSRCKPTSKPNPKAMASC